MKVLVIGGGGREHALAWKLAQSEHVKHVYVAKGNAGTATETLGTPISNVALAEDSPRILVDFARQQKIDLTVVGPEVPLALGVVDVFDSLGLPIFGPNKIAAQMESSKLFCKEVLKRGNVPTAISHAFDSARDALEFVESQGDIPCVVKADGLAAGKGVVVCNSQNEALDAVKRIATNREFGDAGTRLLIEEKLEGDEVSVLAITDGDTLLTLTPVQDHKAAFDGNQGPNTGGMGTYSPVARLDAKTLERIEATIFIPTLHALRQMGITFRGVLYAGLMLSRQGPKVLEYNARFGDPECQPLMMRLNGDLFEILHATARGKLDTITPPTWDPRSAVCVVMASAGYPNAMEKGFSISGLLEAAALGNENSDLKIFHSGTSLLKSGEIVTSGGRVLGVTALGDTQAAARKLAYQAAEKISWSGSWYRSDIGAS